MFSSSKRVNSIVQKLLEPIEQGQWAAGQMLPGQRELAEQLEISRPSLREAITVLETLGVVRSLPGKGVMVLERKGQLLDDVKVPGAATTEERFQSAEAAEIPHEDLERLAQIHMVETEPARAGADPRSSVAIVGGALLRIAQHFVRFGDLLELRLGVR